MGTQGNNRAIANAVSAVAKKQYTCIQKADRKISDRLLFQYRFNADPCAQEDHVSSAQD